MRDPRDDIEWRRERNSEHRKWAKIALAIQIVNDSIAQNGLDSIPRADSTTSDPFPKK